MDWEVVESGWERWEERAWVGGAVVRAVKLRWFSNRRAHVASKFLGAGAVWKLERVRLWRTVGRSGYFLAATMMCGAAPRRRPMGSRLRVT